MREADARGPFCSTVMAVVVVKDVLLFVCLAMNLEFANMVRDSRVCYIAWTLPHAHHQDTSSPHCFASGLDFVSAAVQHSHALKSGPCTLMLPALICF